MYTQGIPAYQRQSLACGDSSFAAYISKLFFPYKYQSFSCSLLIKTFHLQ